MMGVKKMEGEEEDEEDIDEGGNVAAAVVVEAGGGRKTGEGRPRGVQNGGVLIDELLTNALWFDRSWSFSRCFSALDIPPSRYLRGARRLVIHLSTSFHTSRPSSHHITRTKGKYLHTPSRTTLLLTNPPLLFPQHQLRVLSSLTLC
jgi:hypothetical protein